MRCRTSGVALNRISTRPRLFFRWIVRLNRTSEFAFVTCRPSTRTKTQPLALGNKSRHYVWSNQRLSAVEMAAPKARWPLLDDKSRRPHMWSNRLVLVQKRSSPRLEAIVAVTRTPQRTRQKLWRPRWHPFTFLRTATCLATTLATSWQVAARTSGYATENLLGVCLFVIQYS